MVSGNRKKFLLCYPSCFVAQKEKKKKKRKNKKQKHMTCSILRLRSKSVLSVFSCIPCTAQCKHTRKQPYARLWRARLFNKLSRAIT